MSFKICTIGCGHIANRAHGPSYKKYAALYKDTELTACCDLDEVKAKNFKDKYGFKRYYTDINLMLDKEKPDAVCLISPVHLTEELSCNIMEKGYPILLEKPPGLNHEETMKMIEVAEKNNIPNQVAFNRRFSPFIRKLKQMLKETNAGNPIQNITYQLSRVDRKDKDFSTTAIHAIDTVRFIAGSDYKHAGISYQEIPGMECNVVNIYLDCSFVSDTRAQIVINPVAGANIERITVNLLDHSFYVSLPFWTSIDAPGRIIHTYKNKIITDLDGLHVTDGNEGFEMNGFYAENESFFNDIRSGRKPVDDIRSGLQSVEISECIRKRLRVYLNTATETKEGSFDH